VEPLFWRTGI